VATDPAVARWDALSGTTVCSLKVFHASHDGHLPNHFGDSYPQEAQW
jgi:hypothetical protein